jgi:LytS/YehU family sensor histidine kinase
MIGFSVIKAILFFMVILILALSLGLDLGHLNLVNITEYIGNFTGVFCMWNVIYFGFQYFQNYKRAEISSLRYLAASRESELNNLRAQLNPHFIFNCMNSIRALIDENPENAKNAVTRLSNILRNTLLMDKRKEIPLKEELNLVKDYLDLEKIRYEERLICEFEISENVLNALIPPFIMQSQVENAIKHGISKLPGPGTVNISAADANGVLYVRVANSGKLNSQVPLTGVGFKNSIHRLDLLYGEKAGITITEEHDWVVVEIHLPLKK